MRGFEIDRNAMRAQLFAADRADRSNRHRGQSVPDLRVDSAGLRDLHHVGDLVRAGENRGVGAAVHDRTQRRAKRLEVGGHRPSINRHDRNLSATRFQSRDQIAIGDAVFLHCDSRAAKIPVRGQRRQKLARGIGLGRGDGGFDSQIAQRAGGLGSADHGHGSAQRGNQIGARTAGFHHLEERAGADAG